jgi:hypothetical protein
MRRFWLKKGNAVWDLTAKDLGAPNASFLGSPEGLGAKVKIESFAVERAFFVESVKPENSEIGGKLYFADYTKFAAFIAFIGSIETTEPMRLYYSTAEEQPDCNGADEWYKLVLVKEIKKTEIDSKTGVLVCGVKFLSVSHWRQDKTVTVEVERFGDALLYPYRYNYRYGGMNRLSVTIDNTGNLPTPCTVRIEGETDTPSFKIVQSGRTLEQAKYNLNVPLGSYLLINSAPESQEASLYAVNGGIVTREDVYNKGEPDYAYANFITIPSGVSTFIITANNTYFGRVTLQFSTLREVI